MRKKFRGKKQFKLSKIFKIIIIIIFIFLIIKLFNINIKFKIKDDLVKYIISDNNYSSNNNILNKLIKTNTHNIINNPSNLLAINFHSKNKEEKKEQVVSAINDKPVVYLYSSHPKEEYSMEYVEDYNVIPSVLMASYMIKERLDKMGLFTIVEDGDISDYLSKNGMKYSESYKASRHFLLNALEKYDSIKLYIDIHRDAVTKEISTTNIDGLDCAKIMFVVGKEHDNYLKNLENTKHLNDLIKDKYPSLTRGVLEKEGKNVNGIYNQDLGSNIMLIEIGGNYNSINEVMNTIDLITPIIGDYINEER